MQRTELLLEAVQVLNLKAGHRLCHCQPVLVRYVEALLEVGKASILAELSAQQLGKVDTRVQLWLADLIVLVLQEETVAQLLGLSLLDHL